MIINRYYVKDLDIIDVEGVLKSYIGEQSKKFDSLAISVFWKISVNHEVLSIYLTVPNQISFFKTLNDVVIKITEFPCRFLFCLLHQRIQNIIINKVLEKQTVFYIRSLFYDISTLS